MNDTYVTIVGTAMNNPEKRATAKTNTLVASFRVSSHPRHFDQKTGQWVDSPGLRIRVNCWRKLAEHVAASVTSGDPVVVYGRASTRDWKTEEGEARTGYEVDAITVGHDLGRGQSVFTRAKPEAIGIVVEDADADSRVNGELTISVADGHAAEPDDYASVPPESPEDDALAILRAAGIDPSAITGGDDGGGGGDGDGDEEEPTGADDGSGGSDGRSRRRGRQPVPA